MTSRHEKPESSSVPKMLAYDRNGTAIQRVTLNVLGSLLTAGTLAAIGSVLSVSVIRSDVTHSQKAFEESQLNIAAMQARVEEANRDIATLKAERVLREQMADQRWRSLDEKIEAIAKNQAAMMSLMTRRRVANGLD